MKDVLTRQPDVFFLTYDEPLKDQYWENFKKMVPWAQRVDGVKGFDAAHKACAQAAKSQRLFIVDGDNSVELSFLRIPANPPLFFKKDAVLSWPARNSVNGLIYGNGGIKNWSRQTLLKMQSHENAQDAEMAVDFCYKITYVPRAESLSTADIHQTAFQAFRAGLREGVKMSLLEAQPPTAPTDYSQYLSKIPKSNLERLKIWCSVGADVPNGLWAIYGARLGCKLLFDPSWDFKNIHDYDWFNSFWNETIAPRFSGFQQKCKISNYSWNIHRLKEQCELLGTELEQQLGLKLSLYNPQESEFFKSVYINRPRAKQVSQWK